MTAGLPGAGIGGLFYLASTLLLPLRSLLRRARRKPDPVSLNQMAHSVLIAAGIIGALWMSGWLLGFIVPGEMLPQRQVAGAARPAARTIISMATMATALVTLAIILLAVEVAHLWQAEKARGSRRSAHPR